MIACASFAGCATCYSLAMQEPSHCNCGERYSFNEARMLAAYTLHCHRVNSYYCSPRSTHALISAVFHRWHSSPVRPSDVHRPSKSLPITQASGFPNAPHKQKLTLHPLSRPSHSRFKKDPPAEGISFHCKYLSSPITIPHIIPIIHKKCNPTCIFQFLFVYLPHIKFHACVHALVTFCNHSL